MKINQKGNVLVTLLVFVVMAVVIISAVTAVTIINTQSTTVVSFGNYALNLAELGAEEAVIRLIRNPNVYTGGSLVIEGTNVLITVTGTTTKTITSEASVQGNTRKVQVIATVENNKVTVTSWQEIQ